MTRFAICLLLPVFSAVSALGATGSLQVSLLENNILHVQADTVNEDLTQELAKAAPTNRISGTILDLRFADGKQLSAENYFASQKTPLVILVNGETHGAAARLAEQLRADHKAILIGSTNSVGAITPDIAVNVSAREEKAFLKNPYAPLDTNATALAAAPGDYLPFIDHTSEADLVRRRTKDTDEDADDVEPPAVPAETRSDVIQDPELARAVDLLKAIAIMHPARS